MNTVVLLLAVMAISAVGLRVALYVLVRPQRGVLMLVALLPLDGLLTLIDPPSAVRGWKEAAVLATLVATATAPASARRQHRAPLPSWSAPAMGLVGLGMLWVGFGGFGQLTGFRVAFFFLLVPVILWRCPMDAGERDQLVTVVMVSSVAVAIVGLMQQLAGGERLVSLGYEWNTEIRTTQGLLRSIGTFESPFPFAFWVMQGLAVGLPVALTDPGRTRNRIFLWLLPLTTLGMATAIVRGAFVGIAVAVFVVAVWRYRMLIHLLAPGLILMVLLGGSVADAIFSSSSLQERTGRWEEVFASVVERPFGGGLTSSGAAGNLVADVPLRLAEIHTLSTFEAVPQPDNHYLKNMLDLGWPGFFLLVLLAVFAIGYAWRVARTSSGADAALAAGICAALSSAAAAALVASFWEIFPAQVLFWTLLGVVPSLDQRSSSTRLPLAPMAAAFKPLSANSWASSSS